MQDKKITRKQFLAGLLSVGAVVAMSKVPKILKKQAVVEGTYGNSAYGGGKKHA